MYSKTFEKLFDKKPKPDIEESVLENGVTKKINNSFGMVEFLKEETIDGLEYDFHLIKRNEDKYWNLGFGTKHGMLITNKGLAVYKYIIENLVILVNTARKHERINKITFFGAEEELRVSELDEFKNFLKSKTEQGNHIFDNFSHTKQVDDRKKSIRIKNGEVIIEESGKRPFDLKQRLLGFDNAYHSENRFSLNQFVDNQQELASLMDNKDALSALMKHIGADFTLERGVEKDKGKLRSDMYERTLKQKFPDYKFKRVGNAITLFL